MWGEETVTRVAREIMERLASGDMEAASPSACAGQQAALLLCDAPGGASKAGSRT